jgi:molecular chaperone GrpE (heat shock protein)
MSTTQIKATDKRIEALRAELEAKEKELEAKTKENEALRSQLVHLRADFENAKKRWLKAQAESQETAHGQLLKELLEIVDDFERACSATTNSTKK